MTLIQKLLTFFNDYYLLILSITISFLFFTFLLDGFKFSDNKFIRIFQKILFYIIGFVLLLITYELIFGTIIECAGYEENLNNNNNNLAEKNVDSKILNPEIKISGSVIINKEGGEVIAQGMKSGASQIGV